MTQLSKKYPKVSVKAVFRCGNKVLYYKTKKGMRDIPGGHIHFGESIQDALKRELKEEIGFELNIKPRLIYAWDYFSKDKFVHRVYLGYLIDLSKPLNFLSKEFGDKIDFVWLHKDEIKKQKFLPEMEELLLEAVNN